MRRTAMLYLRRSAVGFPPWRPGFDLNSRHVGYVMEEMALGRDLPEYFGFFCQFSFYQLQCPHNIYTLHTRKATGILQKYITCGAKKGNYTGFVFRIE
jgi:hypothetical protein